MMKSRGIKNGYRSGLEEKVGKQLEDNNIEYKYEDPLQKISYTKPESKHKYTPDFPFSNIIIETKGRFVLDDRTKHLLVKQQYPELDIRFVFSNSKAKITKNSKTTYGDWCNKNGFKYADKLIPEEWLKEIKDGNKKTK